MKQELMTVCVIFFGLLALSIPAYADVVIRPAKLGIISLTIQPLFPTISQGKFEIGNTYDFPMNVTLMPSDVISSFFTLSDSNFVLKTNETRTVIYTIKPTQPGVFRGSVLAKFSAGGNTSTIGYQDDVVIIVKQSDSYILVLAAVGVVLAIVVASLIAMKRTKSRGARR